MASATTNRPTANERALLFTLVAVQFTHVMDFMIMMPLGPYLLNVFSLTPRQFSFLVAAYGVAAAVTGLLGGFVLDRFDRKHALLFLYSGFVLSTLACALAPSYACLLAARLGAGACGGVASSIVTAMVGDVIPPARRGRAMGIIMQSFPLASVLGLPTGLWLADRFDWHGPFFFLSGSSALILLVAARALPSFRPQHAVSRPWSQMKAVLSHPVNQRGFLMSAALVFGGACITPFIATSMVVNVGIGENRLWLLYLAGGICTFLTTPIVGRLSDQHDKLHLLGWLTLGASVAALVITRMPPVPVAVAMMVIALFMVTMSGRFTPAMALVINAVEPRYRGGFMSVNSAIQQSAMGLANITAGFLVVQDPPTTGPLHGYARTGLVAVAAFAATYFLAARLRALAPHAARPGGQPTGATH
jgi:predicted MFS family arabinose efflux permease